jgi:hypothetical protein
MLAKPDQFAALKLTQLSEAWDHKRGPRHGGNRQYYSSNGKQIFNNNKRHFSNSKPQLRVKQHVKLSPQMPFGGRKPKMRVKQHVYALRLQPLLQLHW